MFFFVRYIRSLLPGRYALGIGLIIFAFISAGDVPGAPRAAEAAAAVGRVVKLPTDLAGKVGHAGSAAILAGTVGAVVTLPADLAGVANGAVTGQNRDGFRRHGI